MDLTYLPADLARDIDLAVQFRKDTHLVSFGHTKDFDTARQAKVFHLFQQDWPLGLLHVWLGDEIIGQVEFTTPIKQADGSYWGYVYLFYLKPDYRGRGIGQQIHDFVIQKMQADNCQKVHLRYHLFNTAAEKFYLKNGWVAKGETTERGQLMEKNL